MLEQRFRAVLRIQNPNPVDLAVEGIAYELEVNGQPFAKGVGKGIVVIPAFSQGVVETEAITTLIGFIRQVRELQRARRAWFAYRLTGKVKLQDQSFPLRFEARGDNVWSTAPHDPPQSDMRDKPQRDQSGAGRGTSIVQPGDGSRSSSSGAAER